jgi:DNA-binding MarR family transcriptional regulator
MTGMDAEDWADRHVARWRDHWIDIAFDDDVEAIVVRMERLVRHFKAAKQDALRAVGLQDFEYATLHLLMIRDTPGHAGPSALAADLGISNAGMSGRLEALEKAGWVQRRAGAGDRRRVDIEVTPAGMDVWRRAMQLRGRAEEHLVGTLSTEDRATLARLLKTLTLTVESDEA